MNTNRRFEVECFQDLSKNKYVHPFHQTNRGHLIISGDDQFQNDYILGYILRRIPFQHSHKELKILMYSLSMSENHCPIINKYFKKPIIKSRDELMSLLLWVEKTMNNRYKLFYKEKARDIYTFNQKVINQEIKKRFLPHLLIMIHEVPQADDIKNDPINHLLHTIILKSRTAGIHVIITSTTIKDSLSPVLKYHMDGIISKVNSNEKSKILIGGDEATKIKVNEVMVHESLSGKNIIYKLFDEPEKRPLLHLLHKSS